MSTNRPVRKYGAFGMLLLVVCLTGCERIGSKVGATYVTFTKVTGSRQVEAEIKQLNANVRAGTLTVTAGESDTLDVEAEVKIREALFNSSAERGTFDTHVRVSVQNGTMTVADAHSGQPDEKDWHVSLVLKVPARLATNLAVGAGDLRVEGMNADVKATSGAGEVIVRSDDAKAISARTGAGKITIEVDAATGPITANTGAGAIHLIVKGSPPTEDVKLTTAVGEIDMTLPFGTPGTFDLESDVGNVVISGHKGITSSRSGVGEKATGTVGDGKPQYEVSVTTGSIKLGESMSTRGEEEAA